MDWNQKINGKEVDKFCQELVLMIVKKELDPNQTEPYNAKDFIKSQIESIFPDIITIKATEVKQNLQNSIVLLIDSLWNIVTENVSTALRQYKGLMNWCEQNKDSYKTGTVEYTSNVHFPMYTTQFKDDRGYDWSTYHYAVSPELTTFLVSQVQQIYPQLEFAKIKSNSPIACDLTPHDFYIVINEDLNPNPVVEDSKEISDKVDNGTVKLTLIQKIRKFFKCK